MTPRLGHCQVRGDGHGRYGGLTGEGEGIPVTYRSGDEKMDYQKEKIDSSEKCEGGSPDWESLS